MTFLLGHCGADSEQIKVCVRHYRHNHNRAKSRLRRSCEVILGKESGERSVGASYGLIGIQLPEKYKENFDVSSESASSGSWLLTSVFTTKDLRSKRPSSPCIFQVVVSLSLRSFLIINTTSPVF